MGVVGLIHGPDTGHPSEYGGRDDEDVAPREHDAAVLKNNLRENFEEAKFETGKLLDFRRTVGLLFRKSIFSVSSI